MQAADKINKLVQGNGKNEHSKNYSESYNDRLYSVKNSTSMSADELIEGIRDRMQNILMGKKRNIAACKGMGLHNCNTDNGHVLYITLNNKNV